MKTLHILFLLLSAGISVNSISAPKPPPGAQDVNVINTPSVTVTNPQTSVTVDNTSGNPVPVSGEVSVVNTVPIPVNIQNQSIGCPEIQFVGFTAATFNSGQGIVIYTNACQQDHPGSWMCSSEEFLNTRDYPSVSGSGWIKPTPVPMAAAAGTGLSTRVEFVGAQDASGLIVGTGIGFRGMTCRGWADGTASNDIKGLYVSAEGKFRASSCDSIRSVACCAPAP